VKKLERKLGRKNLNLRKSLIYTLLIALAFFAMATSMACARETGPAQTPPESTSVPSEDNPTLIATQDNGTNPLNDNPPITRTQDISTTTPDDNGTLNSAEDAQTEDNPPLITAQAQPDNTATILGATAFGGAIAISAIVVILRRHQKIAA
jgi:cytoskeletal protein RodZ